MICYLKKRVNLAFFTSLIAFNLNAFAQQPAPEFLFGPEWTFSEADGSNLIGLKRFEDLRDHMNEHLIDGQPAGAKFRLDNRRYFHSPNGWWVKPTWDSGSIEVKAKPMTASDYKKYAADIQDAVFVSAMNQNFWPALYRGGGHINISFAPFLKSPLLFKNFIVDLMNHNELFLGIFNYDLRNGRSFEALHPNNQLKIKDALEMYSDLNSASSEDEFGNFVRRLRSVLATKGVFLNLSKAITSLTPDSDISAEESRIEIRGVRPQQSMQIWVNQIELLQARLNYLARLETPLVYRPRVPLVKNQFRKSDEGLFESSAPPIDPQLALQSFYIYVSESGLKWRDHNNYMWPKWMNKGDELEKFEKSEWFKQKEISCGKILQ